MLKEWIPQSDVSLWLSGSLSLRLCMAAGPALSTDKGAMCWNVVSFHYIKHECAEKLVSFCFSIFLMDCLAVSCDVFQPAVWHRASDYTQARLLPCKSVLLVIVKSSAGYRFRSAGQENGLGAAAAPSLPEAAGNDSYVLLWLMKATTFMSIGQIWSYRQELVIIA